MPTATANGITICYDTFGDPAEPALLLVMGYTAQLIAWDEKFVNALAGRGYFVIRFDNRDCGLSTHLDGVEVDLPALFAAREGLGALPPAPYSLSTFSDDAFGLLDHLGIEAAHIAGASMGGMIVQTMAIEHPERVLSMTSIMSATGEPDYGQATPEAMAALLTPPPPERSEFIDYAVSRAKLFCSPRYFDEAKIAERAGAGYDRAFYPEGAIRQLAAVWTSADRTEQLKLLRVPTLVIHGRADTLITPSGGERTAELIPGANLLLLHDMGHDLPEPLWPLVVDAITSHTKHLIG
jgi:pimeloyl-ACP methyl ester carboxylesterase